MRRRAALHLCLVLIGAPARADWIMGRVVAIADGDTLTILTTDQGQHRVLGRSTKESPEFGPEFFEQADEYQGGKLVQRGRRPTVAPSPSRTVASSGPAGPRAAKRRG